ncbi:MULTISPECIES: potassium channel family protein [unclassified Meridianimarinicoccus]|uniref:potassium channel family protein n=1 Tax=unclassified Meridianimarinicoccus TaxID=2923344 RepID=UPI001865CAD2|nr:potassium channel family protein [Fluviibacterium sp. MJW13]
MTVLKRYHAAVARRRWSLLLVLLVVSMLLEPAFGKANWVETLTLCLLALTFIGTIQSANVAGQKQVVGNFIVVIWFLTSMVDRFGFDTGSLLAVETAFLLGGTLWLVFTYLMRERAGSFDSLMGAVFGYVLLALVWSVLYLHIENLRPGAFALRDGPAEHGQLVYFSLVTITTLGYGDILPVDPLARICAGFEAAVGTLYVAVLIGSIVGAFGNSVRPRHTSSSRPPSDPGASERPDS